MIKAIGALSYFCANHLSIADSSRLSRHDDYYRTYPRHGRSFQDYEQELYLTSAFDGLDLNRTGNGRYGRSTSHSTALASSYRHAIQNVDGLRDAVALRRQAQVVQSGVNVNGQRPLDLIPANRRSPLTSRDVRPYQHSLPPTALIEDLSTYDASSPRYGRYERWQFPSVGPISQREHHSGEDPFLDRHAGRHMRRFSASADAGVLCTCRSCVEHRYPTRRWTLATYDHFSSPAYGRYHSRAHTSHFSPTQADWLYRGDDYFSDSLDYDSDPLSDMAYSGLRREMYYPPEPGLNVVRDPYYEDCESDRGYGSDHEYSDGASYTGYEHYGDYSDGEYSAGGYSD